ncbi:DUF1559 family PulG-like putative transporter [Rubinisphaera italica]|uniref:DUF1559 domain-containing protein n=1 Tax=Rubinisphaera italica TaxID=2527969 RepID=A0A5C5XKL8_9PLAN|nr:DUF1559 domain-containing protein [Rubinisphaera italica]TWT62282.1 hypothetical protein Pan54_30230 [Rubinisphaera italica]
MESQKLHSQGFTVIELMITLAIIVVITSLVLPTIQESRNQARERECIIHLKQLGLAMHNYHDVYRTFPPGWVRKTPYAQSPSGFGWQVSILPFVEEAPLYDAIRPSAPNNEGALEYVEAKYLKREISTYRCPADSTPVTNPMRGDWGTSNYSMNYGTEPVPRMTPLDGSMNWPGALPTRLHTNGIGWWNSRVGFRDITDGTSNTLMISERSVKSAAGIWPGVRSNSSETDQVTDTSYGNEINSGLNSFSSPHRGGANILLCDGSVRFLSDQVDSQPRGPGQGDVGGLFQKLGCRNDGQVVGELPGE